MKSIKKYAEFVGYTLYHGERIDHWRCPNKKCGMGVSEEYIYCPYCGQKIEFREPLKCFNRLRSVVIRDDLISRKALLEELKDFRMSITGSANAMALAVMNETKKSIMQIIEEQPIIYEDVKNGKKKKI